jgi:hypothetical protein
MVIDLFILLYFWSWRLIPGQKKKKKNKQNTSLSNYNLKTFSFDDGMR